MEYYIAQFFGFLAIITCFMSYQKTNKKDFFIVQLITNIFYGVQYLILHAYSGCISSVISLLKNILFYNLEKRNKKISIYFLVIFGMAFIVGGIFTYEGIYSVIPVFIHCTYTIATWFKDLKITYTLSLGTSILWIIYSFIVGAYVSIIASIIELIAGILGLRKLALERKKEKC